MNWNHLGQMASTFFEHPARDCVADAMRFVGGTASFSKGDLVELHSLSTANFNGRRGRCGHFDPRTGRHQVALFATKTAPAKTIAVRARNIKVASSDSVKSSAEIEKLLPTKTPLAPGSCGPEVVLLQKLLIQFEYMHPSAIRFLQGFYGPRTTASVAKIAKAIGCSGGGVFTDRIRAHLLQKLLSADRSQSRQARPVSIPTHVLRTVATLIPVTKEAVSVPMMTTKKTEATVSVPTTTTTEATVSVPTTTTTEATVSVPTTTTTEATVSAPTTTTTEATVSAPTTMTTEATVSAPTTTTTEA